MAMDMAISYSKPSNEASSASGSSPKRKSKFDFPTKVYAMLELADRQIFEIAESVSWLPHGRAFRIHNKVKFMEEVVPLFFDLTKIRSFNRQLHLWGFRRIELGCDEVWYHDNFLRGKPECMRNMIRTKIKGDKSVFDQAVRIPNFEALPPLPMCNKPSADVLEAMENAIFELPTRSQSAPNACDFNVSSVPSPPYLMNVERNAQRIEISSLPSVPFALQPSIPTHTPLSFSRKVSDESPNLHQQEMSQQIHKTRSKSSQENNSESCQMEPDFLVAWNVLNLSAGLSSSINFSDFEPLPISFLNDDEPSDEVASFLEDFPFDG